VDADNEFASMAGIAGPNSWTEPVLASSGADVTLIGPDGTSREVRGDTQIDVVNTPAETVNPAAPIHRRVLILADSSVKGLSPYLAQAFEQTKIVRHWLDDPTQGPSIPATIEDYRPDLVLYVMTERNFNKPMDDGSMWQAATDYERSGDKVVAAWPGAGQPALTSHGPTPPTGVITWQLPAQLNEAVAVRIDLVSSAPTTLVAHEIGPTGSAAADGVTVRLATGRNVTYMRMGSTGALRGFTLTATSSGISVTITGIGVRTIA
jgi:hypothetical protein